MVCVCCAFISATANDEARGAERAPGKLAEFEVKTVKWSYIPMHTLTAAFERAAERDFEIHEQHRKN